MYVCNLTGLPIGYSIIVVLTGLPIGYSVIVALTGLPIGYSVIVALTDPPLYMIQCINRQNTYVPTQCTIIKSLLPAFWGCVTSPRV